MSLVILSDFDGTIVDIDTGEYALKKFAQGDWERVEEEYERGQIRFDECMRKQYLMIKASETVIINELERAASARPKFGKLVQYCSARALPLVVVSGGLDFYIRHFLGINGWYEQVALYAPKAKCKPGGIELEFPDKFDDSSDNFKDDLVWHYRRQGKTVNYIGDGLSDLPAALRANLTFAIKGSTLAKLCREKGMPHKEIVDFGQVLEELAK